MSREQKTAIVRFMEKVNVTDGCWEWTAGTNRPRGRVGCYGMFFEIAARKTAKQVTAHRFAYQQFVGPIPVGYEIDHLCKNTLCVNPAHLEAVTHQVNVLRSNSFSAIHARKTACPKGHLYDAANTYVAPGGARQCKACRRFQVRRWQEKHPEYQNQRYKERKMRLAVNNQVSEHE